jgi:hypothetical protein
MVRTFAERGAGNEEQNWPDFCFVSCESTQLNSLCADSIIVDGQQIWLSLYIWPLPQGQAKS